MKNSLSSSDISRLLKTSKPIYTENMKIRAVLSSQLQVGFSINKKCGSAVLRNRFKRQLRAFAEELSRRISPLKMLITTEKKIQKIKDPKNELSLVFNEVYGKQKI